MAIFVFCYQTDGRPAEDTERQGQQGPSSFLINSCHIGVLAQVFRDWLWDRLQLQSTPAPTRSS